SGWAPARALCNMDSCAYVKPVLTATAHALGVGDPCSRDQPNGRRAMIAPSGEQMEIAVGDQQAVVVEVGGGLRSYSAGSRELVDGYRADDMSSSGGGQVLIPWPNRLQDGRYEFDGRRHQLPLNEPEHRNAIHALVRWAPWTTAELEPHRAVMEHVLHPQPGYPFSLRISIEYALTDSGLRVPPTATNLPTHPLPSAPRAHRYLPL